MCICAYRGFAQRSTHLYMHDFAPPRGFLFEWRSIEKNKKPTVLISFIARFEISTESVFLYSCHSVVIWYSDMNYIKSNKTVCCIFLYPAMQKKTGMAVTSRMTCKIGLIWRHMKPSICLMSYILHQFFWQDPVCHCQLETVRIDHVLICYQY